MSEIATKLAEARALNDEALAERFSQAIRFRAELMRCEADLYEMDALRSVFTPKDKAKFNQTKAQIVQSIDFYSTALEEVLAAVDAINKTRADIDELDALEKEIADIKGEYDGQA